jgi:hypothetical protein
MVPFLRMFPAKTLHASSAVPCLPQAPFSPNFTRSSWYKVAQTSIGYTHEYKHAYDEWSVKFIWCCYEGRKVQSNVHEALRKTLMKPATHCAAFVTVAVGYGNIHAISWQAFGLFQSAFPSYQEQRPQRRSNSTLQRIALAEGHLMIGASCSRPITNKVDHSSKFWQTVETSTTQLSVC